MKVLVSWSSGKDSAWAFWTLVREGIVPVGLLTTINQVSDRVSMQGVRRSLLKEQADRLGLPLYEVRLPWPCPNQEYERRMGETLKEAAAAGVTHVAFGDLYLEDVRAYREGMLEGSGIRPLFPIWCGPDRTRELAGLMVASGVEATITCVDPRQLDPWFCGKRWDRIVEDLPEGVDPLGERGEFHTFCHAGPMFSSPIPVEDGEVIERDGFWWADLIPPVP